MDSSFPSSDAITLLLAEGAKCQQATAKMECYELHDNSFETVVLVRTQEGTTERTFKKEPPPRRLHVYTLLSFIEALKSPLTGSGEANDLMVVVNGDECQAVLNHTKAGPYEWVRFPLVWAHPFSTLTAMMVHQSQSFAMEALTLSLDGCIHNALREALSAVRVTETNIREVSVTPYGATEENGNTAVKLSFPKSVGEGEEELNIPTDWIYTGPIWRGVDMEVTVPIKLRILRADTGLLFQLAAPAIDDVKLKALEELVVRIQDAVPSSYPVFVGEV